MNKKITIYTDGACSMNKTWTGAWGFLIVKKNGNHSVCAGHEYNTTNNRMEVMAILKILERILEAEVRKNKTFDKIEVISDSGYAVFPFTKYNWKQKWYNKQINENTLNFDLWNRLLPLVFDYFGDRVKFTHIRGHGKNLNDIHNYYNDIVDKECVKTRILADELRSYDDFTYN